MTGNHSGANRTSVRMELKYCEHCGGLWVREGGAGVYCEKCQEKVANLPIPKKKAGRIVLPIGRNTVVDEQPEMPCKELEFEAAGGVA